MMAIGRSQPKRRAPAASPVPGSGILGVLLAVAGVLFVVVMITRGDRTPARGAAGTKRGSEARGAGPSVQGAPAVTAESDAWPPSPHESASPGSEDRGRMHKQRAEVAGSPPDAVTPD